MLPLEVVVVLALATYRAQRLVTGDSLTLTFRDALYRFAWTDHGDGSPPMARAAWRTYIYELFTCPWCLGVWAAGVLYVLYRWGGSVMRGVIVVLALAAVAGFLAAHEDTDD